MTELFDSEEHIPIILGGYVNGLSIARSFGRVDIQTVCLDVRKNLAFYSKYSSGMICPDPVKEEDAFIDFLIELGKQFKKKGVFFATNDIWLFPICRRKEELSDYYLYPMSDWPVIEECLDKSKLYSLAEKYYIPYPKTISLDTVQKIDQYVIDEMIFPCVLKPSVTVGFLEALGSAGRTIRISNPDELIIWKERIIDAGLSSTPMILQEEIIGGIDNLYTITSYSDHFGEMKGYSIGHKIRQNPPLAGTITSGKVDHKDEVLKLGTALIKATGYHGIANTEFKYDKKNKCFKLIEINPRPGMWNLSALESGVNLPYMAYCDITRKKYDGNYTGSSGKNWVFLYGDLVTALFREENAGNFFQKLLQWYRSLNGEWIFAVESFDDIRPGLWFYVSKLKNRIFR